MEPQKRPSEHIGHVIVERKGYPVWCARDQLRADDVRVFFDGDYKDVLEPDDPRVKD